MAAVNRDAMVAAARQLAHETFGEPTKGMGSCLALTWSICTIARRQGLRLIMQAGSAHWPRVTNETDDGTEPNLFGYEWDLQTALRVMPSLPPNWLPEIHIWAADPVAVEIVDLSTGAFPTLCKSMTGLPWKAPQPPAYFWGNPLDVPTPGYYHPQRSACEMAVRLLRRALGDTA